MLIRNEPLEIAADQRTMRDMIAFAILPEVIRQLGIHEYRQNEFGQVAYGIADDVIRAKLGETADEAARRKTAALRGTPLSNLEKLQWAMRDAVAQLVGVPNESAIEAKRILNVALGNEADVS